jgi:AcrR family transcriptional regulator
MEFSRRDQLLEATIEYLLDHGVGDLSLRPLAAAIGTKARLLMYHFGSREQLVSSALSVILGRIQRSFLEMLGEGSLDRALLAFWRASTGEANGSYLRLLFEVHGLAVHDPETYGEYLRGAFESWKALLTERMDKRLRRAAREERATLMIAVIDGLLLDYLATGDLPRTTRALRSFTRQLEEHGQGDQR